VDGKELEHGKKADGNGGRAGGVVRTKKLF